MNAVGEAALGMGAPALCWVGSSSSLVLPLVQVQPTPAWAPVGGWKGGSAPQGVGASQDCLADGIKPFPVADCSWEEPNPEEIRALQPQAEQRHRHREHSGGAGEKVGEARGGAGAPRPARGRTSSIHPPTPRQRQLGPSCLPCPSPVVLHPCQWEAACWVTGHSGGREAEPQAVMGRRREGPPQ